MSTGVRLRKRIPLSEIAKDVIRAHPDAYALMTKFACRGIFLHLKADGELFYFETQDVSITLDQFYEFNAQTVGLTAICAAAGLRRQALGEAS